MSQNQATPNNKQTKTGNGGGGGGGPPPLPSPGSRVGPWLSSPLGALAFGPRAALGALLTLPERLGSLPRDLERARELLADPRPPGDKTALLAAEAEARLVAALEAGARAEQAALASVAAALPPDAARAVEGLLPRPPAAGRTSAYSSSSYEADWMTSTEEGSGGGGGGGGGWDAAAGGVGLGAAARPSSAPPPPSRYEQLYGAANAARRAEGAPRVTYTAEAVAARQVASELAGVRQAVAGLKTALEGLRSGGSDAGARAGVLRLNVREARDALSARLEEVGPPPPVPPPSVGAGAGASPMARDAATLAAAGREARMLLSEVDGQFGF